MIQVSAFFEQHDVQQVNEVIHLLNGHGTPSQELNGVFQERLTILNADLSGKDEVLDALSGPFRNVSPSIVFFSILGA
ncbi:hypothetical protein ACEQPO_01065 [Bacillus sp. SL00103]